MAICRRSRAAEQTFRGGCTRFCRFTLADGYGDQSFAAALTPSKPTAGAVIPLVSRLKQSLSDYIEAEQAHYVQPRGTLFRLYANPIPDHPTYVTKCTLNSISRGRGGASLHKVASHQIRLRRSAFFAVNSSSVRMPLRCNSARRSMAPNTSSDDMLVGGETGASTRDGAVGVGCGEGWSKCRSGDGELASITGSSARRTRPCWLFQCEGLAPALLLRHPGDRVTARIVNSHPPALLYREAVRGRKKGVA